MEGSFMPFTFSSISLVRFRFQAAEATLLPKVLNYRRCIRLSFRFELRRDYRVCQFPQHIALLNATWETGTFQSRSTGSVLTYPYAPPMAPRRSSHTPQICSIATHDLRMPPSRPLPPDPAAVGYGALAAQMDFDADLSIYRRFGALQARTILYLQAEISSLEKHLLELDQEADANPDLGAKESTQSWSSMQKNGGERLEIAMQIRQKLKEYSRSRIHS